MKIEINKGILSKIKKPTMLVSLPLAHVANVTLNALAEQLHAQPIGKLFVDRLPIVFVRKNKPEFPAIRFYHKKVKNDNLLFVLGEHQPKEESVFSLCSYIISLFKRLKGKKIIVLDGVKTKEKEGKEILYLSDKKLGIDAQKVETIGPLFGPTAVLLQMAKQAEADIAVILTKVPDTKDVNINHVKKNVVLLNNMLHLNIDLRDFDTKIKKLKKSVKTISRIEEKITPEKQDRGYIG